jgi:hypothetical protein
MSIAVRNGRIDAVAPRAELASVRALSKSTPKASS